VFETDDAELALKVLDRARPTPPLEPQPPSPISEEGVLVVAAGQSQSAPIVPPPGKTVVFTPDGQRLIDSHVVDEAQRFTAFWWGLTEDQRSLLLFLRHQTCQVALRDIHAEVGKNELQGFAVHFTNIAGKAARCGFREDDIFTRGVHSDRRDPLSMITGKRVATYGAGDVLIRRLSFGGHPV